MRGAKAVAVLAAVVLPAVALGQIFKCVDAVGNVAYQSAYCPKGSEEIRLKIRGGRAVPVVTQSQDDSEDSSRIMERHSQAQTVQQQRHTLPVLDTEMYCENYARTTGTRHASLYNLCIETEQSDYDSLARLFGQVSTEVQEACTEYARSIEGGSYGLLKLCIENEATALQNPAQFRR